MARDSLCGGQARVPGEADRDGARRGGRAESPLARKGPPKFTIGYSQRFNPKFAYVRQSIRTAPSAKPVVSPPGLPPYQRAGKKISGRREALAGAAMESTHDPRFVLWS